MANPIQVENPQVVLVEGISGPGGSDRMYITLGMARTWMTGSPGDVAYAGLIEPTLQPGQFRRAVVTASLMTTGSTTTGVARLADVDADWDDESGKVGLRFSAVGDPVVAFQAFVFAGPPSA